VDFRGAFIGKSDRDAFAAHVIEAEMIFLLNPFPEVLGGHIFLGELDLERASLFLRSSQPAPVFAEPFLAGEHVGFLPLFLREPLRAPGVDLLALVTEVVDVAAGLDNFAF
jgi:hypothetical protein